MVVLVATVAAVASSGKHLKHQGGQLRPSGSRPIVPGRSCDSIDVSDVNATCIVKHVCLSSEFRGVQRVSYAELRRQMLTSYHLPQGRVPRWSLLTLGPLSSSACSLPSISSLVVTFHTPASVLRTVLVFSSHHSLELRPERLDGRELVANLPEFSLINFDPSTTDALSGFDQPTSMMPSRLRFKALICARTCSRD